MTTPHDKGCHCSSCGEERYQKQAQTTARAIALAIEYADYAAEHASQAIEYATQASNAAVVAREHATQASRAATRARHDLGPL